MTTITRPLQSLSLRQAIIERLRADTTLASLGSPTLGDDDRIYERTRSALTWPFVRYDGPDEIPLRQGTQIRFAVHAFSKAKFTDEVAGIDAAIQGSLEDAVIELSGGLTAYVVWIGSQILADPAEADAHHGVNAFNAVIG
jgi:hypothetical protein